MTDAERNQLLKEHDKLKTHYNELVEQRNKLIFTLEKIVAIERRMEKASDAGDTELADRLGDQLSLAILRAAQYMSYMGCE